MSAIKAIALDAMGVIYTVGDDLRNLLIPYLRSKGTTLTDDEIIGFYRQCYRGELPADALWSASGCAWEDGRLEDDFIAAFELVTGVREFLQAMKSRETPVFCLSNDVAEWAIKRRAHFNLDAYFDACIISGEQKVTKPAPEIFDTLASLLTCSRNECLFVDDRKDNVKAAIQLGFQAVLFSSTSESDPPSVRDFLALRQLVEMSTSVD